MAKSEIVYKSLIACVLHSVIKIGEQGQCNITMLTFENLICMGMLGGGRGHSSQSQECILKRIHKISI
jgi:hypothetical protein